MEQCRRGKDGTAIMSPSAFTTHVPGQVVYVDGGAETTLRGPSRF